MSNFIPTPMEIESVRLPQSFKARSFSEIPDIRNPLFEASDFPYTVDLSTCERVARHLIQRDLSSRHGATVLSKHEIVKPGYLKAHNVTLDDFKSGKAVVR